MNKDPKAIHAEFGIDLSGKDPAGQYQWKMLSLNASSEERQRLEKAWAAYVLDRKLVDVPGARSEPAPAAAAAEPGVRGWIKRRWVVLGLAVLGLVVLWLVLHDAADHRTSPDAGAQGATNTAQSEWRTKYEAIKTMLDESGHDDAHHDEFVLLAEAAKAAITGGEASLMLEQLNADLAAERNTGSMQRITVLASHTAQWKVIVQALVMNKAELLDHEKFEGHHEGEL